MQIKNISDSKIRPRGNCPFVVGKSKVQRNFASLYLHNCWLEKKTVPMEALDGIQRYRVTLYYEKTEEPELRIRLLSMGPDIQILSPESLRREILRRVRKQRKLLKQ